MMRTKFILGLLSSALIANTALHGVEVPVPFKPQEIAAKARKQGLPAGLSVTAEGKALKIAASDGLALPEPVTITHAANVPPQAAGRDVTVKIRVSGSNLKTDATTTITVGGQKLPFPQGSFGWKTLSAKIKCPANGKLPITICLQNFSGTLMLQEPTAQIELSHKLPAHPKRKRR